ncbi:hypothetical protein [uncultured Thiohalocapsa sp.]|uniref:hypothetical protein n=1 Tax=uncultured Thiohalocapsa sp. TaxID=768990 RepID=UPI0025D34AFA|nr:hypothetical protein [uncultured Thiohalocapsa sp.]
MRLVLGLSCGLALCLAAALPRAAVADERTGAAGWLQLERDQRTYRERAGPLDLRESRELSAVERRQRNDLRVLDQRLDRAQRLDRRLDEHRERGLDPAADHPGVTRPPTMPRREAGMPSHRALERQRLQRRMRQERQPFGRLREP